MEFSSFDAPSFPPPGGEPTPTTPAIPSSLPAPTLPAPDGAEPPRARVVPALPPPSPATLPTDDPAAAVPTLPPPAGRYEPSSPAPVLPPPESGARPEGPSAVTPGATPASPARRPSRTGLALATLAALAVVGLVGWQLSSGEDRSPEPAVGVATDDPAIDTDAAAPGSGDDATIGAIGVEAIEDARELVDQLDERSETEELLNELGLGPDGEPVVAPPALDDPAGYAFVWTDPNGDRVGALVDAIDGDYAIEGSDGVAVRVVEGVPYARSEGEWRLTDLSILATRPVPALDGFPTVERIIHAGIEPYVLDTTTIPVADGTAFGFLVDDSALFAADPAAREAWLLPWGLREGHRPPPVADSAELTDARADAGPGQVIFTFTVSPAGELVTVTVSSPAIGGLGVLDQIGTSAEPPTIELAD